MKKILSLILLLGTFNAFAFPALHDYARFEINQSTEQDGMMAGTIEIELVEFNQTDKSYKKKTTTIINGQNQVEEEWVKADDLVTDAQVDGMLQMCTQIGGQKEMVMSKAGHFDTCVMTTDDQSTLSKVWIGKAPFGVIKLSSKDKSNNATMDGILVEFKNGQ